MNIVVDENIPRRTVEALRSLGHVVTDVRGGEAQGEGDDDLWQRATEQRALLISTDKGFRHKHALPHWGILIIRLRQPNALRIHIRIMQALTRFPEAEWPGLLVMVRDRSQSVLREKPPEAT